MKIKLLVIAAMLFGGLQLQANEQEYIDALEAENQILSEALELNDENTNSVNDEDMNFQNVTTESPWTRIPVIKISNSPFKTLGLGFAGRKIGKCSCSPGQRACMKVRGRNHRGYESSRICVDRIYYQTGCWTTNNIRNQRYMCSLFNLY